jgi:small subunit ribosomal protein S1
MARAAAKTKVHAQEALREPTKAQADRAAASIAAPSRDDFAAMLEESFQTQSPQEGAVIKGRIVAIENDMAVVDVGLKTEGRISIKEFAMPGLPVEIKVGDEVEVYLERVENALGEAVLSRD